MAAVMRLEIEQNGERTDVELRDGIFTFGGAPSDAVRLPGTKPGSFAALIDGRRVVVEADEALCFDGVFAPPKVRRLWLPEERLTLEGGVTLRWAPDPGQKRADGTVAVVQELFSGDAEVEAPRLLCLTGLDLGREFPLVDGETAIGRGEAVGLRIRDRAVSRKHARVHHEQGKTVIEDLGTLNGIYVQGKRARGPVVLQDGDVVELGRALLKFLGGPKPEPAPAAAETAPDPLCEGAAPGTKASKPSGGRSPEWVITLGALAMAVAGAIATWTITG